MQAKQTVRLPAGQIALTHGLVTLIWPLTLHMEHPPSKASIVEAATMGFAADLANKAAEAQQAGSAERCWIPIADPLEHIARPARKAGEGEAGFRQRLGSWENEAYAEAVYFHEFIQAFLYRQPREDEQPPFRLFRRNDIHHARVRFAGGQEKRVDVERVNLYIFRTGVAVFTMDLVIPTSDQDTATSGWTLGEFQTFHDLVRRAYAPYFTMGEDHRSNGHLVLDSIAWLGKDETPLRGPAGDEWTFRLNEELDEAPRYVGNETYKPSRYPPLFRHWRVLLTPDLPLADYSQHVTPSSVKASSETNGRWHHVVDERMATLATVSVTDAKGGKSRYDAITDGDMVRLCFADKSGDADFPYDEGFLKDFDARYAYDRFKSWGTRYLVSGYSFVALIGHHDPENFVPMHMRRHYFQMMLLAQMEMASLLGFSGQVSRAVQRYGSGTENRAALEKCMSAIQEEFLQFVHRFRFTGVSNQVQAQEIFELLRTTLRSQELFDDVKDEIAVANDFLRAEASDRATRSAEWLSLIGGIGVLIGVIIGLMSTNFIADVAVWRPYLTGGPFSDAWAKLAPDLLAACAVCGLVGLVSSLLLLLQRDMASTTRKPFLTMAGVCAAIGLIPFFRLLARYFA